MTKPYLTPGRFGLNILIEKLNLYGKLYKIPMKKIEPIKTYHDGTYGYDMEEFGDKVNELVAAVNTLAEPGECKRCAEPMNINFSHTCLVNKPAGNMTTPQSSQWEKEYQLMEDKMLKEIGLSMDYDSDMVKQFITNLLAQRDKEWQLHTNKAKEIGFELGHKDAQNEILKTLSERVDDMAGFTSEVDTERQKGFKYCQSKVQEIIKSLIK